jgi:hypothetical protein
MARGSLSMLMEIGRAGPATGSHGHHGGAAHDDARHR